MALTAQDILDAAFFNQETDATPINECYLLIQHPSWTEPKRVLFPLSATDSGVLLGGNLITSSGWTFAGWTGNESIGWTHTTGNTSVLSNTIAATIATTYEVQVTVSGRTAGNFIVAFGGDISPALISSNIYSLTATTNGNLTITPSSDFNGTILISIKEVVWELTEQEILDILGKESLYSQAETDTLLNDKVDKITGSSLIADTEKTRLESVKPNPYKITMPAGNITTKVAGATFTPTGWGTVAQSGVTNILITSILTGRKARFINVFEVDGSNETLLSVEKGMAYTQFVNNGLTTLLYGFAPTTLPVEISLIFD